jgi:hypothetical protein
MDRPHLRPRVSVRVPHPPDALCQLLDGRLAETPSLEGRVRQRAVLVWMAKPLRCWWSPCLDLNLEPDGSGTRLTGRYTAHPRLMTASVFAGIGLTFLACLSATWSLVQWTMREPPRCLGGTLAALLGLLAVYGVHRLAQRRAVGQMHALAVLLDGLGAVEVDEAHAFDAH